MNRRSADTPVRKCNYGDRGSWKKGWRKTLEDLKRDLKKIHEAHRANGIFGAKPNAMAV